MNKLIWILLTGIMDFPISKRNIRHIIIQPWWQRYYRNYNFHERYMNAYKIPHREFESFGAYITYRPGCPCNFCIAENKKLYKSASMSNSPPDKVLPYWSRRYGETYHADFIRYGKAAYGDKLFEEIKAGTDEKTRPS